MRVLQLYLGVERRLTDGHQPPLSHNPPLSLVELLQALHDGPCLAAFLGLPAGEVLNIAALVAFIFYKLKTKIL